VCTFRQAYVLIPVQGEYIAAAQPGHERYGHRRAGVRHDGIDQPARLVAVEKDLSVPALRHRVFAHIGRTDIGTPRLACAPQDRAEEHELAVDRAGRPSWRALLAPLPAVPTHDERPGRGAPTCHVAGDYGVVDRR
jgi:hypothetical protein